MATRGLRARINEKCRDCIYDPANRGNWRQQVYLCSVTDCALWDVRPTPTSTASLEQARLIATEELCLAVA
jgi:hypothetical protein